MRTKEELYKSVQVHSIDPFQVYERMDRCMDEWAKESSIEFFKWNAEKVGAFVVYLQDVKKLVRSNEIEENLVKFEGATIEERYELFLQYLETQESLIKELK